MSNQIIKWVIENNHILNLQIKNIEYLNRYGLYQYKVTYPNQEDRFDGHGISTNEEEALAAAIGECLERYFVYSHQLKSSNGCAFHTNKNLAIENAKKEILERNSIQEAFEQKSFVSIPYSSSLINQLFADHLGVNLYKTAESFYLCKLTGPQYKYPFCNTFGHSVLPEKAIYECLLNLNQLAFGENFDHIEEKNLSTTKFVQQLKSSIHIPTGNESSTRSLNVDCQITNKLRINGIDIPGHFAHANSPEASPLIAI